MLANEHLVFHECQIQEIQQGIKEADAGELIAHEQIIKKWKLKQASSLAQISKR